MNYINKILLPIRYLGLFPGLVCFFIPVAVSDVVINEIMYHPFSLSNKDEFIEIYNAGSESVDLTGWKMSKGVHYTFTENTLLLPDTYLSVSPSPEHFRALYGDLPVVGPYSGQLSNAGEIITLVDANGRMVDRVFYQEEQGWPAVADGYGPSIERRHPHMSSIYFHTWSAGPSGGTPSAQNQNALVKPLPIIHSITHYPVVPASSDAVRIVAVVTHGKSIQNVLLWLKSENEAIFNAVEMFDDGLHGDGDANDGIYAGSVPPYPSGMIVEFFVEAVDEDTVSGFYPLRGADDAFIYQVDDTAYPMNESPTYRIVLRSADDLELRTRSPYSNELLPATFIFENDIYYNVGLRLRGKGSRHRTPKSYRIHFADTQYFGPIRKLNLNGFNTAQQYIGLESFQRMGMFAPEKKFVSLIVNQDFTPGYLQVERTDSDMMARIFDDSDGNIYRGVEQANLVYWGNDPYLYRPYYVKETNEKEDDYSDIIDLCEAFTNTGDAYFVDTIGRKIKSSQWIRWFAIKQVLNDMEGGLSKERGDDYYIYHYPGDDLFYLLPWDLDSVLDPHFLEPHHHGVAAVRRLLRHPDLARFYYQELRQIMDRLTPEVMTDILEHTSPVTTAEQRARFLNTYTELCKFNRSFIPDTFSIDLDPISNSMVTVIKEDDTWEFYRGTGDPLGEPLAWTMPDYDSSLWEIGQGGFGYGDNDDRTLLEDMEQQYLAVFIRRSFEVGETDDVRELVLSVLYDDGYVAYLNGVEIARQNVEGIPTYQTQASAAHEANDFELVVVDPSLLRVGKNTLAMIGVNRTLDSSDFSINATLTAQMTESAMSLLRGTANAVHTRWVEVNGDRVAFEPWTGLWSHPAILTTGRNKFDVKALDADLRIVDASTYVVYRNVEPPDGIEILGDEVFVSEKSPYIFDTNVIIPSTDSLTIEPGVTMLFPEGAGMIVYGTLTVAGNQANPVLFGPREENGTWGGIAVDHSAGPAIIRYARFSSIGSYTFRDRALPGAITVDSSTVTVEHVYFGHFEEHGIEAVRSFLTVRYCTFEEIHEGVHCNACSAILEFNHFLTIRGYHDAIDFDFEYGPPSIVRGNTIYGGEDDGIDLGGSSALIERNWIMHCADKGISLEGKSSPVVRNNIIAFMETAIASKDQCHAYIAHNTIVGSTYGVHVYEKNAGAGGASAIVINTVVWDTVEPLAVDSQSSLEVFSCNLNDVSLASDRSNFSLEPLFVNEAEHVYIPAPGSPLIDAGRPIGMQNDIDGHARFQGLNPDIGAYETNYVTLIRDWLER
jgi:hypothetical protein